MIDKLLHHGKVTWLNCPDEPRSGTLKLKNPTSPRISKKNSIMHIFGKICVVEVLNERRFCYFYSIHEYFVLRMKNQAEKSIFKGWDGLGGLTNRGPRCSIVTSPSLGRII